MSQVSPADAAVRPASPADAAAIAAVQRRVWHGAYAGILPPPALAALDIATAEARWRQAAQSPPTRRHRLLVATEAGGVVGFAAAAPATDEDLDPAADLEILSLLVAAERGGRGHGSRLLAAITDLHRADGGTGVVTWLFETDAAAQAFFESAGFALDGAGRDLDMGELVHQVRLRAVLP